MVKNTIHLDAEDSSLSLSVGKNNWCEVKLHLGNHSYHLGAEDKTKIVKRLQDGLCKNDLEGSEKLDGISVLWVLSLAEKHTSIYVGISSDTRQFFFQNEAGETFAKISLTQEKCKKWIKLLREDS